MAYVLYYSDGDHGGERCVIKNKDEEYECLGIPKNEDLGKDMEETKDDEWVKGQQQTRGSTTVHSDERIIKILR
tara:strand:+ start:1051 stop:1272 length:222 start_codon:yes stop_codon:yes gene_type:complete